MARRQSKGGHAPAPQYPPPSHRPKGQGGGNPCWILGDGAPLDAVERARGRFDADAKRLDTASDNEVLELACSYWLAYPIWLEQVGCWWARESVRHEAYCAIVRVHRRATEILMQAAERLGIDSAPIFESAEWCRQLLAEPETYRPTGEVWPVCMEASRDSLPDGAWTVIMRGEAVITRLGVKLNGDGDAISDPDCAHSPDFRSVRWRGEAYSFTRNQALCMKQLWEAWEAGTPEMDGITVTTVADVSQTRLVDVFKSKGSMHPAWGTVIVPGETKGSYRLSDAAIIAKKSRRTKTRKTPRKTPR